MRNLNFSISQKPFVSKRERYIRFQTGALYSIKSVSIGLIGLAFCVTAAHANLGDEIAKAKSRTADYERQFGAVAPLFKWNKNNKIIWECWAAPPEEWTKQQATQFARFLVSGHTVEKTMKHEGLDGTLDRYTYPDGTTVILEYNPFSKRYAGVEVYTAEYEGTNC